MVGMDAVPGRWVVGESFGAATRLPWFATARTLRETFAATPPQAGAPARLKPALGTDPAEWAHLRREFSAAYGPAVVLDSEPPAPVARHTVLKHRPGSVLIGDAHAETNSFRAQLAVCDGADILQDPAPAACQVPLRLLLEAGIQAVTWAVGALFPPPAGQAPHTLLVHGNALELRRFVHPLPTRLDGILTLSGIVTRNRIPLHAQVHMKQAGRHCATFTAALHAYAPALAGLIDEAEARRTLTTARL
jgi:hypothetical protein